MFAGFRHSSVRSVRSPLWFGRYSYKVDQPSWLFIRYQTPSLFFSLCFFSLVLLSSVAAQAQLPEESMRTIIHGSVTTPEGQPVPFATVEVRDLRGTKMAAGLTSGAGSFAISTAARSGEYVLLAAKRLQIRDQRITLDQSDLEVKIALPVISGETLQPNYTISARELSIPEKARAHLKLAHQEFSRLNLAGAAYHVEQALRVQPTCAAAFSMRSILRIAVKDPDGAIADAKRAMMLDPYEADAYVALATAYNSLREFQNAEQALEQALVFRPDFWQAQLEMAKALYGEDRFVVALHELDELNKDFPDVHLVRANVLVRLQRNHEAGEEFTRFVQEAPDDPRSVKVKLIVARLAESAASAPSLRP
jgi:tetratricopeptide (TPR) repeat protein